MTIDQTSYANERKRERSRSRDRRKKVIKEENMNCSRRMNHGQRHSKEGIMRARGRFGSENMDRNVNNAQNCLVDKGHVYTDQPMETTADFSAKVNMARSLHQVPSNFGTGNNNLNAPCIPFGLKCSLERYPRPMQMGGREDELDDQMHRDRHRRELYIVDLLMNTTCEQRAFIVKELKSRLSM
eukprot:371166_1